MRSLTSGLRAAGQIENLSLGGCRIQAGDRHGLREGEKVEMTFTVRQLPLRVQASVRQVHSGQAVGVAFTLLSERGKLQLQSLIEELAEVHRDQVDSLIRYQSSPGAVHPEQGNGCRSAAGTDNPYNRFPRGPVPVDRKPR